MIEVKLDQASDWGKLRVAIDVGKSLGPHLQRAVMAELQYLRKAIVEVFDNEGPPSGKWKQLSALTIAARALKGFKGTKPLQVTRDLVGSITVIPVSEGGGFVGVARTKARKDGKDPVNIAWLQEMGFTTRIPFGPKQRRFLFAAMKAANIPPQPRAGAARGVTSIVIRVPARPFIGPILEEKGQPAVLAESIMARMMASTNYALGTTGTKPRT